MSHARIANSPHFVRLRAKYKEVGDATWRTEDFTSAGLEVSRDLFTPESLAARVPQPKALEVVALLSGLPFAAEFVGSLGAVQAEISAVLEDSLHYWVAPANLGVEYCVFKWPTDPWATQQIDHVQEVLASARFPLYSLRIDGVQINPDGCVVAKGFDENAALFAIREYMRKNISFLPARQSGWAHVPLGRRLEPLGAEKFRRLAALADDMSDRRVATTVIDTMKLVHETCWYMEARTILVEISLAGDSPASSAQ